MCGGGGGVARSTSARLDALRHLPHGLLAQHVVELVEHRQDALVLLELVLSAAEININLCMPPLDGRSRTIIY